LGRSPGAWPRHDGAADHGALIRARVRCILTDAGHEARTAADAAQALALLQPEEPVDILFTDINLGDDKPNGLALASEAVQMRKGLKLIYTTGAVLTDGMPELCVADSRVLPKPYIPDQ